MAAPPLTSSLFTTTAVVTVSDLSSGGSRAGETCLGAVVLQTRLGRWLSPKAAGKQRETMAYRNGFDGTRWNGG